MAWIVVVPPSPATRTSATRCATRKASGSARLASSLPGAEHLPRSGRSKRGRTELAMAVDFDLEQLARTLFGDRRDEVVAGPEGPALHRPSTVPAGT
jgi:hypothetical protein